MASTPPYTAYFILTGCPIATFLHGLGIFLLIKSRKTNMDSTQRNIITSLSTAEFGLNVFLIFYAVVTIMYIREISPYIWATGIRLFLNAYYLNTLLLTINRLMRIHFNILYPKYWTLKHTRYSIIVVWITSIIGAGLQQKFRKGKAYTDVTLDVLFLFIAVLTYVYAAYQSLRVTKSQNQLAFATSRPNNKQQKKMFKGFFLSSMIIITFIFFQVVPHGIFLFIHEFKHLEFHSIELHLTLDCLQICAFWSDALIYIFLSPYVKQMFRKTFALKRLSGKDCEAVDKRRNTQLIDSPNSSSERNTQETRL